MIKNKRAWIRIVEAFVAILLIIGVLLIVLNKGYIGKKDISAEVYNVEISILREIQLNDALRNDILNANPPVEWGDFKSEDLGVLKNKIISRLPNYLDCEAKICEVEDICVISKDLEKDVYAQSVIITTTLETPEYNPRQLKLFCWIGTPPEAYLCGDGICEGDETWETCPEDCEVLSQICSDAGGTCKPSHCSEYDDCSLLEEICETIVVETGCVWNFDDECNEWSGGGTRTGDCGSWYESKDAYECYDYDCTSLQGTCGSGYCCSGSCTVPVPTCAELGGTICTGDQTCSGTLLEAIDSTRCCSGTCQEPQAILTLMFSGTVYELKHNVNIGGTVYSKVYYYYYTRTFTENNGVGVTLTQGQQCFQSIGCDPKVNVNYRIEPSGTLVYENKYFYTTSDSDIFTLKYWGTDDNGYDVYIEQKMCVQKSQFTENC